MSADAYPNYDTKITELEIRLHNLLEYVKQVEQMAKDATQKSMIPNQGGGGGGGGDGLMIAYTPSGGIPCATVSGTPPSLTWVFTSEVCWVYRLSGSTATYVGTFPVFNPYTSGSSTGIGAGKGVPVIADENGNLWGVGEPCP